MTDSDDDLHDKTYVSRATACPQQATTFVIHKNNRRTRHRNGTYT
jgi:hypothetical protein